MSKFSRFTKEFEAVEAVFQPLLSLVPQGDAEQIALVQSARKSLADLEMLGEVCVSILLSALLAHTRRKS